MNEQAAQNKIAWEYDAYDFWVKQNGAPAAYAREVAENPRLHLRKYAAYFGDVAGVKIANLCGSCGKKALPLALMGAEVTLFDLSEANLRYAREAAEAAGARLKCVVGDALKIDMAVWGGRFDVVFMEGGVLHYFADLDDFLAVCRRLLRPGGRMILSDFHPINKCFDTLGLGNPPMGYFDARPIEGEMAHARFYAPEFRARMPKCLLRRYTLAEIVNAVLGAGFAIERFDEHPAWTNPDVPGEFTLLAASPRAYGAFGTNSATAGEENAPFWRALDALAASCPLVVDRAKGARHPRYPHVVYPLDYGYLEGSRAMDGAGIDVWRGGEAEPTIGAVIVTVDLMKRDAEIKLLIGCTEAETRAVLAFHNETEAMKGTLIRRGPEDR